MSYWRLGVCQLFDRTGTNLLILTAKVYGPNDILHLYIVGVTVRGDLQSKPSTIATSLNINAV